MSDQESRNIDNSTIGIIGNNAHVEGGIHFCSCPRPASGIPLQRPERAEHFINRKQELAKLLEDMMPGRFVTLCGPGGIGKSALVSEAIWNLCPGCEAPDRFPDGIIFYSFYGNPDISMAFQHIVKSFDEEARDTSKDAAFRLLAGKRALLMLDGTEEAENLPKVLEVRGQCGVIVSSRLKKDATGECSDIKPLPAGEAVKLLRAWGGDPADYENAARHICELLGGLPLAIRLAGRYMNQTGESASEYLEWLKKTPLEALDQGNRRLESVPLLIKHSLEKVSESARKIIGVCGLLSFSPFTREVLSAALPDVQIRYALDNLVFYSLVRRTGNRFELSHALIHTYAREELKPDDATLERIVAYYQAFATDQCEKGLEGYTRLDLERAHIMRVIKECEKREEWYMVSNLVVATTNYLHIRGYWTEWVEILESGIRAAWILDDQYNEGIFLLNLGSAFCCLGQIEKTIECYEQGLEIFIEIGHRNGEGAVLGNMGIVYGILGETKKAIKFHKRALAISQEIGDYKMEGNQLSNLGEAYISLGQPEKAIHYLEKALFIAREIGDRNGEGIRLGNMGVVYQELGQTKRAVEYHEKALEISREIGNRSSEGRQLGNMALIYYSNLGQIDRAINYYEQALEILKEIGDGYAVGNISTQLALIYAEFGQEDKILQHLQQALVMKTDIIRRNLPDLNNE